MADHEEPRITLLMPFDFALLTPSPSDVDRLLSIRLLSIIGQGLRPRRDERERIHWLRADQAQEKACPGNVWLTWAENPPA